MRSVPFFLTIFQNSLPLQDYVMRNVALFVSVFLFFRRGGGESTRPLPECLIPGRRPVAIQPLRQTAQRQPLPAQPATSLAGRPRRRPTPWSWRLAALPLLSRRRQSALVLQSLRRPLVEGEEGRQSSAIFSSSVSLNKRGCERGKRREWR